ncbi:MAG TPA: MFS transporter, partial [Bacteroidota bacterium]|nr:MFS transporter [Bacteroidota bacterium]
MTRRVIIPPPAGGSQDTPRHGIRENLPQFALLVVVNAFVGAMVGLERSVLPLLGEQEFGLTSTTAILSFLLTFGPVKAFTNLFAGRFADALGRKKLLVAGWLFGIPVPFLLMYAQDWSWVVSANLFLGLNQGLCWSMAVVMKIDIAGPERRGLATGLNEFSGYLAVALAAYATAEIAAAYGLRTAPFSLGIIVAISGLLLSVLFVMDTRKFVDAEVGNAHSGALSGARAGAHTETPAQTWTPGKSAPPRTLVDIFSLTWRDRRFFACHQAGMVNNLNDALAWAVFPLFFASLGFSLGTIGILAALYPAVWGVGQLVTGPLSDRIGRRGLIAGGMIVQAAGICTVAAFRDIALITGGNVLLGIGTAMVYPTLLASVSDLSHPGWRATALGVYRFWRDIGYALGALLAGAIADLLGAGAAIAWIGALTFLSG